MREKHNSGEWLLEEETQQFDASKGRSIAGILQQFETSPNSVNRAHKINIPVCGSARNLSRQSIKLVPLKGSPPMPTQVDWREGETGGQSRDETHNDKHEAVVRKHEFPHLVVVKKQRKAYRRGLTRILCFRFFSMWKRMIAPAIAVIFLWGNLVLLHIGLLT